ncbi:MAG: DUF2948 family protein [Rhodospirillaceae bacterium]|nr:DUF2948 family protein [Rhodospirillaceae bacterium]
MPSLLKLLASDKQDLGVLSACLQDAVIAIREMTFLPGEKRFVFVANRFRWEDSDRSEPAEGTAIYERVHCGICFDGVTTVRQQGLVQQRKGQIVSLLAIESDDGAIELLFSAGIVIRLEVDEILCHLQDLDEPWPTQWRPTHPLDD